MTDSVDHTTLLQELVDRDASDLHLKAGSVPAFRIGGELERHGDEPLTAEAVAHIALALLTKDQQQAMLRDGSVVGAHSSPGIGRFRVAVFRQRGSAAIVVHAVPHEIRRLEDLGLPDAAERLAGTERGLVLIASPVGNGATTTLGAMVDFVNRNRRCHIVTVDDPIESLHPDDQSMVSQLEVGADIPSLQDGIRAATRLDADVVAVSDVVDRDTAVATLDAVARGRLVFAVIGGDTVHNVVSGFLELFTFEERPIVRQTFARALAGVLVQRLLPGKQPGRLVVVCEALVKTQKIERILADEHRMHELPGLMQEGIFHGMQTMDQALRDRVKEGLLDEETALAAAVDAEELRIELLRG